jgi:hypothetical protein
MAQATIAGPAIKTRAHLSKLRGDIPLERSAGQALDGGDVLPGFVLPLADLLDRGQRPRTRA